MTVSASGGPMSDDVNALAERVRGALEYLHMLSRSPSVNTPVGNDALAALDGLVEAHARQEAALRLACAELQDLHADFVDNRRSDYEPPDGSDVDWLVEKLLARAALSSPSERGSGGQNVSDGERLPFFPPPEEWSAWLAEPAGTPYPWLEESDESDDDAT